MATIPELYHCSITYLVRREVNFPAIFHLSIDYEGDYFNLLLKPKRRDDAQTLADCTIINYTNLAEVSLGVPVRTDAGGIIYLRVDDESLPFSLTLRTVGKKDVVFTNVTLDGSCPVGLDRIVSLYFVDGFESKINGAAFDGENQTLV